MTAFNSAFFLSHFLILYLDEKPLSSTHFVTLQQWQSPLVLSNSVTLCSLINATFTRSHLVMINIGPCSSSITLSLLPFPCSLPRSCRGFLSQPRRGAAGSASEERSSHAASIPRPSPDCHCQRSRLAESLVEGRTPTLTPGICCSAIALLEHYHAGVFFWSML